MKLRKKEKLNLKQFFREFRAFRGKGIYVVNNIYM